ncbi:MAG TPA: Sua5 family C-terminal domain-containing protein, partial [Caldisericia bacterium]|nr:Sua5 family C-terminal domain-containing protein [Caldisericia bacterium]
DGEEFRIVKSGYVCGKVEVIRVSESKDPKDYAINMFEAMHTFEDDEDVEVIVAEAIEEIGIGKAIMDRLKKAAFHWQED